MNSRVHASEGALAALVCERSTPKRVLVGGLGMGFTLAGVLRACREAQVVVVELVPEVVEWNRGPLAHVAGNPLADRRVTIRVGDVAEIIRSTRAEWDAILLDVDNGPAGLTSSANDWLYAAAGLRAAHAALRPGGMLGIWSAGPDPAFTRRLAQAGFEVESVPVRGRKSRGPRYVIWLARAARKTR